MDKPAKQKHNTSADTPNQLLSASHTIELLARISAVLLADPLSERTRGRQKVLALCTAASAFIAISGARMDELSLFGMTFEEVNKQMLTYSLAATCLMLLVIFLLSDYFDFAAARYTTLSATMEVTAALNTLQSYLDWEEPERLEFERQITLFSMNAYVDMRKRHVMGEQVQALSKAKDLEIKRLHEQFGSNVYDGIDIDALHSSDVSVSTTERNKLIEKSMPSFYPLAEQRGGNVQERIRILTEENEQSEKFLKN